MIKVLSTTEYKRLMDILEYDDKMSGRIGAQAEINGDDVLFNRSFLLELQEYMVDIIADVGADDGEINEIGLYAESLADRIAIL